MKKVLIGTMLLAPSLAFAQLNNVENLMRAFGRLVDLALPIVVGIALLGFFWGLVEFIFAAGDAEKKDKGKTHMIWGLVALFVMVSVWGLVRFIGQAFNIEQGTGSGQIPRVEGLR